MHVGKILLILLLTGCTQINNHYAETIDSWRWGHSAQLLRVWGTPNEIAELPNGNHVYLYQKETYKNYPGNSVISQLGTFKRSNQPTAVVVPARNTTTGISFFLSCATLFEIDPRGIIVDVRAQGNSCTADAGFAASKRNPKPASALDVAI